MALRDTMRTSATPFLAPGEEIQAIFGAQTASQWIAALAGLLFFLPLNRYRIVAVTPTRIVVLDAGRFTTKKARSVAYEVPRSTVLGRGTGIWHKVPMPNETLRVHRRFFKDLAVADGFVTA